MCGVSSTLRTRLLVLASGVVKASALPVGFDREYVDRGAADDRAIEGVRHRVQIDHSAA